MRQKKYEDRADCKDKANCKDEYKDKRKRGNENVYNLIIVTAILIELLLMCVLEEFLLMGIMILTIGILILYNVLTGFAKIKKAAVIMAVYCFVWGSAVTGFSVAQKLTGAFSNYDIALFVAGLGMAMAWLGIYMGIYKKIRCNLKISACYTGAQAYKVRASTSYTPEFSFSYEGTDYFNTSGECFSARKLDKRFQIGESYPIYIDPQNPNSFCVSRGIDKSGILLLLLGILFLFVAYKLMIN